MIEPAQLTLDGREAPVVFPSPSRGAPLTPAQRAIMQHLAKHGEIRPVEAGMILLEHSRGKPWLVEYRRRYASADGSEALRRLAKRGLVHKDGPGRWVSGPPAEPVELRRSEKQRRA